ncbi:hypothetical protein PC116_g11123 [Phytophthora cactorum]|uniref:Uncharacterized protein n=1 Tax=Phytophthora cactorum TaxID=29920 RepID=A0A329S064_9STRA|nr:hypothetical protein PC113_g19494 [Phytophthora cactorum]KAG2881887.1 hypothetical protein PC114_g21333 [Phytophthora cactorum]KAG2903505.1 hypothetical protein PC117_g21239 [Phytophthora cactorum]KAG2966474.1 hypothetical protein PC118_g19155 [Phytophthora cactorum]KAG3061783.1 hypothetical protein PC122_g19543 [Phytophthora cactorum]
MVGPVGKTPRNKLTARQRQLCLEVPRRERRVRREEAKAEINEEKTQKKTRVPVKKKTAKETAAEGKKAAAKANKGAAKAKQTVAKETEDTSPVLSTSEGEEVESVFTNMVTVVERTAGAATPTRIPDAGAGTGAVRPVSLASRGGTPNQVVVSNPRKRRRGILQDDSDDDESSSSDEERSEPRLLNLTIRLLRLKLRYVLSMEIPI